MAYAGNVGVADAVAQGDLQFGLSSMRHLGKGNVSISPIGIRTALAMLYEGATGDTAKQLAQVAALPEDAQARLEGFKALTSALNPVRSPYTLRFANGLWVDNAYPINPRFSTVLIAYYEAKASSANFKYAAEWERSQINGWVSDKTEGRISELFTAGAVNKLTALALANALYFKAEWEEKFDPRDTRKQAFTLPTGVVQVDMMKKRGDGFGGFPEFHYGEFKGIQIVSLPYKGHGLENVVMLPPLGMSVESLEERLIGDKTTLNGLCRGLERQKFSRLEMPRHELRGSYDLGAVLSAMGIDRIFSREAELGGIGDEELFVSSAVHQTFFKTNEEGSEGAAAMGLTLIAKGLDLRPHVVFVADRPYLEAVVDSKSGAVLFLNRVVDPR